MRYLILVMGKPLPVPMTVARDYLVRDERLSPDERRVERGGERGGRDPCKDGTAAGMMKMAHEITPFEGLSRAPASTGGLRQLPVTERIASRIISTTVPGALTLGV